MLADPPEKEVYMIYRYKVPLNGESIKVYLILAACAVIGIGSFFVLPKLGALAVLAICGFVAYQILKAMAKAGSARITTYTDGFSVRMADGTKLEFEWDKVSYAGYVVEGIQKGYMFVYEEDIDKFVKSAQKSLWKTRVFGRMKHRTVMFLRWSFLTRPGGR